MIACLSLVQHSHVRVPADGSGWITACGLEIEQAHVGPAMFAAEPVEATCPGCRNQGQTRSEQAVKPSHDWGDVSRTLVEDVVGANQADAIGHLVSADVARWFTAERVQRLHDLFPGLGMTVDDILSQAGKILVRYTVRCHDRAGLIGDAGAELRLRQAVVLEFADGKLAGVDPLVDDFALWQRPANGSDGQ